MTPYHLDKNAAYFGFNTGALPHSIGSAGPKITGFGQAPFAPPRFNAHEILVEEFRDILPQRLIQEVADALPGSWMWKSVPPVADIAQEHSQADIQSEILDRLASLEEKLDRIAPIDAIGRTHNCPPEPINDREDFPPVTVAEKREAMSLLSETKSLLSRNLVSDAANLATQWKESSLFIKLGAWALKTIAEGLVQNAALPYCLSVWSDIRHITDLLLLL